MGELGLWRGLLIGFRGDLRRFGLGHLGFTSDGIERSFIHGAYPPKQGLPSRWNSGCTSVVLR